VGQGGRKEGGAMSETAETDFEVLREEMVEVIAAYALLS
jgi:hypothetical protein